MAASLQPVVSRTEPLQTLIMLLPGHVIRKTAY